MSSTSFVVRMRSAAVFAFACAAVCGTSLAAAPRLSYSMPSYVMEVSPGSSTSALDSQKLAFPGMTLDDVKARLDEGYVVGSCQCGGNSRKVPIQNQSVLVCRNSGGDITKIVVVFAFFDDNYTKSVGVELTNGSEGVYARARRSQYISGDNQGFVFAELNAAGDDVVYSADSGKSGRASGSSVVGYGGQGYGASGLALVQMPGPAPSLVWTGVGGVLTLEDIRDYELSARLCGSKLGMEALNAVSTEYNRYVEEDSSGAATAITVEFQVVEGSTLKCVVVRYTNGPDGVYAQTLGWGEAANGTIGQRFMAADGTYSANAETSGRYGIGSAADAGCGVYALAAKPRGVYTNLEHLGPTITVFSEASVHAVGSTWTRFFADVSLQDLVDGGYKISGWLCGSHIDTKRQVVGTFKTYTPAGSDSATKGLCVFAAYDGGHTKAAIVDLETRADGVYVKLNTGRYLNNTNNVGFDFASFDENGNVVFAEGSNYYSYDVGGICADTMKFMRPDEARRVWANPYGGAVLTLDDIKDHYFGCRFSGAAIGSSIKGGEGIGLNRVFTYDGNGSVTSMLVEFQIVESPYDKCVVMDFTNGEDGVYGRVRRACYIGRDVVGYKFTNDDGSPAGNGANIATSETSGGYGIYGLFAAPMVTLEEDTEWYMFGMFDDTAVVNLNGYSLSVDGLPGGDTSYARIINTNVDVTAELHVNLPAGTTCNNVSAVFGRQALNTHNIRFFKGGLGTYIATGAQEYSGGTEVVAGTLKAGKPDNNVFGYKTAAAAVKVDEGAVLDWNGNGDFNGYPAFVLDGGTVQNTGNAILTGTAVLSGLTLLTNSCLKAAGTWGLINGRYAELPLSLGGNELDIEIAGGKTLYVVNVAAPDSGSVNVHGDGVLEVVASGNGFNAPGVDLRAAGELRLFGGVSVHDYVAADTKDAADLGTGVLSVGGTFTPETAYFRGCTMRDGSKVDLSGWGGAWPVKSSYTCGGNKDIMFDGNATVTIEVGEHALAIGSCLVEMTPGNTPGPTVNFVLCTNGVAVTDKELTSKDNEEGHGLYIKDARLPSYAKWDVSANHWRFYFDDGTEYPEQWPDGVTSDMQVRFSTMAEYEALLTNSVTPSAYVLTGFDSEPGADNDLTRDLPFILSSGMVFDVKGGRLKLPAAIIGGEKEFTVTSSLEGGVLEVAVSQGVEIANTKMSLAGSLKVEKVGAGSFTAVKSGQTYTGGTHVIEGTLKAGAVGIYGPLGDTTSTVVVEEDGVLDWNGYSEFDYYPAIVLNGGTVQNTGSTITKDMALLKGFVLQTNSYFRVPDTWCLVNRGHGEIAFDLAGNTLDIDIEEGKKIYFSNVKMSGGGVVNIHGAGVFEVVNSGNGFSASNVNLRAASALQILKQTSVHDYEAADTKNASDLGTGVLSVYGTFKPVTQYFRGCTLQDGSTLDLSGWTGGWPVASAYTCSGNKTIEFAEGATITVRIGGSNPPNRAKIVGWAQKPAGVAFVRAAGDGCALIVKDDGIYIRRGFAFLVM